MPGRSPPSPLKRSAHVVEAFLYGTIGALIFAWMGIPAGLVSGAMLAVGIAALAGRPVPMPRLMSQATMILLGVALGATVTPDELRGIASYPLSVLLLLIGTLCIIAGSSLYLRVVHRWDSLSALLASGPGAVSQSILLAAEMNANVQGVVIVQILRVMMLAAALGPLLKALDLLPEQIATSGAMAAAAPLPLAITLAVATIAGFAFLKLRLPGGQLLGAMIGSAALHGTGLVTGGLPPIVFYIAMIATGVIVGGRFANISPRIFFTYLGAGAGSFVVGLTIAALFMIMSVTLLGSPPAGAIIAYVPGALDTMMIMALAMNIDPLFVGAHQISRMVLVMVMIPALVKTLFGRSPKKPPAGPEPID